MKSSDQSNEGNESEINKPERHGFLIAGVGASAGGILALKNFFAHVPADSGIAYVVILHLSPDHDSKLAEVLQQTAKIPVSQVTEKTTVKPNRVYVVPPNQHLSMKNDEIIVSQNMQVADRRAPIDIFFRTLAESQGANAVCVVLSGTGANGSMGLKHIKEKGGAAFVQNPREAEFNEMPRNAISTDMVDAILPVAEIPGKILAYKNNLGTVHISIDAGKRPEDQQNALREIFTQLRIKTGHDFTNYKRPTLIRRIERRITVKNLPDLQSYATYIQQHPEETTALLKDLLISVTNFFRDKKAFEAIQAEVLPPIIHQKNAEEQVRIWVAGCATGEEAYSMAIMCAEQTLNVIDAPKIQIFATDIDEDAIAHAREGFYTINDAADVSAERLRRFFNKEGDGYRVRREIREMVLFANHNFIKDPPFSHLDLVACRNVLIYLNRSAQERVLETFHFALNPEGYLFLGTSESADGMNNLYTIYSREHHIFKSRQVSMRAYPVPDSVPMLRIEQSTALESAKEKNHRTLERITYGDLHLRLLEQYAPPSVVINEEYDIVHLSDRISPYLQLGGGEPSQNLLKLVRQELRLELRSALYQAIQQRTAVDAKGLRVKIENRIETINLHVRPVLRDKDIARGFILVIFEKTEEEPDNKEIVISSELAVSQHLEEELMRLKSQLRSSNEQHEFQAEELKASNEELQAMNEELRSAAEELETSKEELQSMNEELRTVNQELKVKIEETSFTSNNLQNLINSANIGTIFLDRSLRIALFTPAIREIFNLIPADYGRPLSDITHKLEYNYLLDDADTVLEKLNTIEREVTTADGRDYIMRVLPYRTTEDQINGVVITFIDIHTRKQAEEALRQSERKYRTLFNSIDEGFSTVEVIFNETQTPVDYRFIVVNPAFERQTGLNNAVGKRIREIAPLHESFWFEIFGKVALTGEPQRFENHSREQGHYYDVYAFRIGEPSERLVGVLFNDITERKKAEKVLHNSAVHHTFLLKLNDALRNVTDAGEIMSKSAMLLGNHLLADNVGYAEMDTKGEQLTIQNDWVYEQMPSLAGTYNLNNFGELGKKFQSGHTIISREASLDDRKDLAAGFQSTQLATSVITPLNKSGKLVSILFVHQKNAREWTEEEVKIIEEVANRTWLFVKQARTEENLRQSEAQTAFLLKFNDRVRGADPHTVLSTALQMLGEHLNVSRVGYGEVNKDQQHVSVEMDWTNGSLPHMEGAVDISAFSSSALEKFHSNLSWSRENGVVSRATNEVALPEVSDATAAAYVPVVKKGSWVALLFVHHAQPRAWTSFETDLMREVADRTMSAIERAKIQTELIESEERVRLATDVAKMFSWEYDFKTKTIKYSENTARITGLQPHENFDENIRFIHRDDQSLITKNIELAIRTNGRFDFEIRLKRGEARSEWYRISGAVIKDRTDKPLRAVGVAQNITEQKALQQQKDDFIGIASHELKTPVTSIKTYTEVLQELFEKAKDMEKADLMHKLDEQVDRLTELIKALLDTTKIAEGQLPLIKERLDLNTVLSEEIHELTAVANKHHIVFNPGKIKPVEIDRERINQVISNLVTNAIKYSPEGSEIVVTSEEYQKGVKVTIRDQGIGIAPELLEKVFERFFRVNNSQVNTFPGMGLGLYITAGIINRHNGTVHVESKVGEGSIFYFTLPY
ncbi:CheR family methyltransferase [Danxiaibacter flavus]|uniref:histidine kinase n=1 Tax=Danxiaibacter flavus TaxID=3049108 RepID=A0ABV3ZIV7_9BACT|nr:CheR family methyltransferase [Chitinophagaceae bacterium DXS]